VHDAVHTRDLPEKNHIVDTTINQLSIREQRVVITKDEDIGLKSQSLMRLGFLAVLPSSRIAGSIGSIAAARHTKLLKTSSDYLVR
jgi:mRNA interferase MazF